MALINSETWREMEQLYKDGLVRAIGVCNFKISHLEAIAKTASILEEVPVMSVNGIFLM